MKNVFYLWITLVCVCFSCGDFLEEYSQNSSYVESVDDLDELLLGGGLVERSGSGISSTGGLGFLHILADESQEVAIPLSGLGTTWDWQTMYGFWLWRENPFINYAGTTRTDGEWALFYKRISVLNSILEESANVSIGKEEEKSQLSRIVGECYYLRAWNYFMLANLYGLPYDKNNLNDGGSVTLKLDATIEDTKFSRANTGDVYQQMVTDLKQAIGALKAGTVLGSKLHATEAAAWALLSRVYLYMEEYTLAVQAADSVKGYKLYDLVNNYTPGSGEAFLTTANPEVIHVQGKQMVSLVHQGTGYAYSRSGSFVDENGNVVKKTWYEGRVFGDSYCVSDELAQLFDENDARYSAYFACSFGKNYLVARKYRGDLNKVIYETDPVTKDTVPPVVKGNDFNESCAIRYAEVILNKAEAQACAGDAGAVETMRTFLATRYYEVPEIPASGNELIEFIRQERYKELCFEGHRWFDLRRYAVNTVYKQAISITHEWHTKLAAYEVVAEGYNTLKPYSDEVKGDWVLPVPEDVIDYCFPALTNFERTKGVVETKY